MLEHDMNTGRGGDAGAVTGPALQLHQNKHKTAGFREKSANIKN